MKTLYTAYRATDLEISLDFYAALGYREVSRVDIGNGATLTMLKFPDEDVVTLEIVYRPAAGAAVESALALATSSSRSTTSPPPSMR